MLLLMFFQVKNAEYDTWLSKDIFTTLAKAFKFLD